MTLCPLKPYVSTENEQVTATNWCEEVFQIKWETRNVDEKW